MPSADIAALTTAITGLTAAVSAQSGADLAPLVAQVQRVADATVASNVQIATVIGTDTAGDNRVRTDPNTP